jgi:hypothetical protein
MLSGFQSPDRLFGGMLVTGNQRCPLVQSGCMQRPGFAL